MTFRADRFEGDLAAGRLTLQGGVEIAYDRYRLRSDRLQLLREGDALVFTGEARAALCPCPDPVVTFLVSGGRIEPPGDLILRFPRLAITGVPVLGLPWLWLRAPDQIGLLPPIVAVRGADGLLLGSGVHLPWRHGGQIEGIDLTAGGYVVGGAEIGAHMVTEGSETRVLADLVQGTRVALEGRGALLAEGPRSVGAAWAMDAVRGDRARSGTVELEAAARPFDTAAAEVSWRAGAGPVSAIVAGGAIARSLRGEGLIAAGPRATLAVGGPIGGLGSWSADAVGVVLGDGVAGPAASTMPLGRASAGAEIDARPGPFEVRAGLGARGRFADDGAPAGPSSEGAAAARADVELPFVRSYGGPLPDGHGTESEWRHWIIPALSVRGALAVQRGGFFVPIGGVVPPASWTAAGGGSSVLGRSGGAAIRLDVRAGATGGTEGAQGLLHARLGVDARVAAAAVEAAGVGEQVGAPAGGEQSGAVLGRVRVGALTGAWVRVDAAAQGGPGAGRARAIAAGAWAALPGDELAYLSAPGWTGGAEVSVPWGGVLRTSARADADLAAKALLAVRGSADFQHPCGCFGLGLLAAHRTGREGVDVVFSIALPSR